MLKKLCLTQSSFKHAFFLSCLFLANRNVYRRVYLSLENGVIYEAIFKLIMQLKVSLIEVLSWG